MYAALDTLRAAQALALHFQRPVLYIALGACEVENVTKAAPYLSFEKHSQIIADRTGFLVCEDDEEVWRLYNQTIGDDDAGTSPAESDNPDQTNPWRPPPGEYGRIWAVIIDAQGRVRTENT